MKIHGLQKMTLLDFPGKVACTVFLGGCDMRCPFCHNSELLTVSAPHVMESAELLDFLKKRVGLLDGVAFTGGEPLLRPDLAELFRQIKNLGYAIKLDTNGGSPEKLAKLAEEKLVDYVAMDVKNSPERYAETTGVPNLNLMPYRESVSFLLSDAVDYEFRTTVVAQYHDEASFEAIGDWIAGAKRYFLQAFTDRDTVPVRGLSAPGKEQLERYRSIVLPKVKSVEIRGV